MRNQFALFDNVSDAGMVVGADHLIRQAKFADQIHRPRLGGHESVGAFFEHAALLHGGLDHAAYARPALQQRGPDARFGEVVSGGKTGDPAADDQRLVRTAYILNSRTKSTTARTLSGGVSGRIP